MHEKQIVFVDIHFMERIFIFTKDGVIAEYAVGSELDHIDKDLKRLERMMWSLDERRSRNRISYRRPVASLEMLSLLSQHVERLVELDILAAGNQAEREKVCADLVLILSSLCLRLNRTLAKLHGRTRFPHHPGLISQTSGTVTSPMSISQSNKPKPLMSKSL